LDDFLESFSNRPSLTDL